MKQNQMPQTVLQWREERKILTLTGEPVLEFHLRWPEWEGGGRQLRRISRYYARLAQAWRRRWEKEGYLMACCELCACRDQSRPFHPWQANLDGSVQTPREGLASIQMDAKEVRSDGKPLYTRSCTLWDLAQGGPVPLGQELGRRFWKRKLLTQIAQAARRQGSEIFLDQDYPRKLKQWFLPERFHLAERGLEVFYPQCAIAPGVEGIVTFLLEEKTAPDEKMSVG